MIMTILVLVRNFVPAHDQVREGNWDVAAVAKDEFDLEGKTVGTVAVGRIGERVLRRLKAFDCKELLYYDYQVIMSTGSLKLILNAFCSLLHLRRRKRLDVAGSTSSKTCSPSAML